LDKPRLTLSTFTGTDPDAWLNRAAQYFELNETEGNERVRYAAYYLDGEANVWWQWLTSVYRSRQRVITWGDFERELLTRFGISDYHNYDEALSRVRQTGSLRDYLKEFGRLACRVRGWPETALVGTFIGGLKFDLAAEVRLELPESMHEAMEVARRRDDHLVATRRGRYDTRIPEAQRTQTSTGTMISSNRPPDSSQPQVPEVKRLSLEEMRHRREKGLCYKCGESFTPGHQCKRLFLIDVIEEDEEEAYEDQPTQQVNEDLEISVNAMAGLQGPRTIRLPAKIKERPIEVLVDTGSSHNFICDRIPKDLELKATKVEPFDIRVANGERLRCHEYYREVPINLQGEIIKADLYALPIVGPEIVLGIQWLEGLGEVTMNYKKGIMEFYSGSRLIMLKTELKGKGREAEMRSLEIASILEDKDVLKGGGNDAEVVIEPGEHEGWTGVADGRMGERRASGGDVRA
ncbi:Unknown protein, partial [Striga hermonthica]